MENILMPLILELESLLLFMEKLFSFITAMNTPENFMKLREPLKDHLLDIKMINGQQELIVNGFHKRIHK